MFADYLKLPKMDGAEIAPRVFLIGEPSPIPGTAKLRALADVRGELCLIELALKFDASTEDHP